MKNLLSFTQQEAITGDRFRKICRFPFSKRPLASLEVFKLKAHASGLNPQISAKEKTSTQLCTPQAMQLRKAFTESSVSFRLSTPHVLLLVFLICAAHGFSQAPGGVSSGLKLWLRADTGTGTSTHGAAVSTWSDQSTKANNASQATASSKPTYKRSSTSNLNFNPILYFDGNDGLTIPYSSSGGLNGNVTAFSVYMLDSGVTGNWRRIINNFGPSSTGFGWYIDPGIRMVAAPSQVYSDESAASGKPEIGAFSVHLGSNQWVNQYVNGKLVPNIWGSGSVNYASNVTNPYYVGFVPNTSYWIGQMGELIQYDTILTATDRLRVYSYLSIKYGLPLDQTTATHYLATDGSIVWNANTNRAYANNIAGIGRDDAEWLYQKQSKCVKTGFQVSIGLNNIYADNRSNPKTFSSNKSYLIWGDNNSGTSFATEVFNNLPSGIGRAARMGRIWKTQKTGSVDSVMISIPASYFVTRDNVYFIQSTDSTFGTACTWALMSNATINGVACKTVKVSLNSAVFFTFGNQLKAPGGIAGPALWLKPDYFKHLAWSDSTNVSVWKNSGSVNMDMVQPTAANQPKYRINAANALNYVPVVNFTATANSLLVGTYDTALNRNVTVFSVNKSNSFAYNIQMPIANRNSVNLAGWDIYYVNNGTRVLQSANGSTWSNLGSTSSVANNWNPNQYEMIGFDLKVGVNQPFNMYLNGSNIASGNLTYKANTNTNYVPVVGKLNESNAYFWDGGIAEQIVYPFVLNTMQRNQVYSYLAIKYGLTNRGNYYASDSNIIAWKAATNIAFKNNIAGLGRDDVSGLYQRQSKSSNPGNQVELFIGQLKAANHLNTATVSNDKSYLIWGDNGGSFGFSTDVTNNKPGGLGNMARMANVWKVQRTSFADSVTIALQKLLFKGTNNYLLLSTDSSFNSGTTWITLSDFTANGINYKGSKVKINSNLFFTFASNARYPGAVSGARIWLKANDAVNSNLSDNLSINTWLNNGTANTINQTNPSFLPVYKNNGDDNINFNPVVKFNGTNQYLMSNSILGSSTYTDAVTFIVSSTEAIKTQSIFMESLPSSQQFNLHLPWNNAYFYWDGASSNRVSMPWGGSVNVPYLWSGWNSNSNSPKSTFYRNGLLIGTNTNTVSFTGNNSNFYIGCQNVTNFYQGKMGEVLIYLKPLSATEKLKVESYLAIKYGMTLDQTTPQNYLATNGSKIWDANLNKTFNQNIAGIGRDDDQDLIQKQSKSSNFNDYLTVGIGKIKDNNQLNTSSFSTNLSYLTWGDNGGAMGYNYSISNNVPSGVLQPVRMGRIWKFQKTGVVDSVEVAIPSSLIPGEIKYMVVSTDSTFGSACNWFKLDSMGMNSKTYYSKKILVTSGQFITFVSKNSKPGGVSRVATWLKADDGINIALANNVQIGYWSNIGNGKDAAQTTSNKRPFYRNNSTDNLNFNPVLAFDGVDDQMNVQYNANNNGNITAFSIHAQNASSTNCSPFASRNTGAFNGWAYLVNNADRQLILGSGSAWNQITSSKITTGKYELLSFDAKPGSSQTANIYTNNGLSSTGSLNYSSNTSIDLIVGAASTSSNFWNGNIAEQILFDTILNAQEKLQVNTYLAVKYGIGINQSTPTNYIATDGTTIVWNANKNRSYRFNLAGIGRDDIESLSQKQSASANQGRQVVIAAKSIASSNKANTNTIGDDKSYLVWGDNDSSMYFAQSITNNLPSGVSNVYRMKRVWKVQKTGNVNEVQIAIPGTYSTTGVKYLVVSSDSTFSSGNTWYALTGNTVNNMVYWGANLTFTGDKFFTFVGKSEMPGGVGNMSVWLKANDYLFAPNSTLAASNHNKNISYWSNAGSAKDFIQDDISKRPLFKYASNTDYANFNPNIAFGFPYAMKVQGDLGLNGNKDLTVFAISKNASGAGFILQPDSTLNNALDLSSSAVGQSGLGLYNSANASGTATPVGSIYLSGGYRSGSNLVSQVNGANVATASSSTNFAKANAYVLNTNAAGNAYTATGNTTSELIIYPYALSNKQRQQVSSYLAIKYGITLNPSGPFNYLSSDSNQIIWNATKNIRFNKNMVGIGRDDIGGLDQRISQSCNTGNQLLIANNGYANSNLLNASPYPADKQFLICGDNDSSLNIAIKVQSGLRMSKVWKAQKTSLVTNISVGLPSSVFSNNVSNKYIIISTDSTFKGQYRRVALSGPYGINGVNYYATTTTINDGDFFTFADLQCNYPVLASASSRTLASAGSCTVNGWLYYKDPSNLSQSLVAIHPNGNTWNPDSVIIDLYPGGTYTKTDGVNTTGLSKRMLTIVAPGTFTVNGGVKIRMYYDPSDFTGLPSTTWNWFKHKGTKFDVLKHLRPDNLDSCVLLRPDSMGLENGINYVEFSKITAFSTFGYGGSTNLTALPLKLIDFKAVALGLKASLNWRMTWETSGKAKFLLQRSSDGVHWVTFHAMEADLTGNGIISEFSYVDQAPYQVSCFYRIRVEPLLEGSFYSPVEYVEFNGSDAGVSIYPNPSNGKISLKMDEKYMDSQIEVCNAEGTVLFTRLATQLSGSEIDLSDYPDGLYFIRIYNDYWQHFERMLLWRQ